MIYTYESKSYFVEGGIFNFLEGMEKLVYKSWNRNYIRNIIQKSCNELQQSHHDHRDCCKTSVPKRILGFLFKICIKLVKG